MHTHRYSQTIGGTVYVLKIIGSTGEFAGSANGTVLFTCTVGARVITTMSGAVTALVGITPSTIDVTLTVPAAAAANRTWPDSGVMVMHGATTTSVSVSLAPNAEYDMALGKAVRSAPYTPPFN